MMSKAKSNPIALTIAGSDSGGGAGIQADLKTFAALGVHGTSAITCITAQNPKRVLAIEPCSPAMVRKQIEVVMAELPPAAAKTGMLYSDKIIRAIADVFEGSRIKLVVDPVMVSTSGRALLTTSAVNSLKKYLLPAAILVTPNVDEAKILIGRKISSVEDLREGAREIFEKYGCAVLMKGGHLKRFSEAMDIFFDGNVELLLSAPFIRGIKTHGTGCTYSAAITAYLARGSDLPTAVTQAKTYISQAIAQSKVAAGHSVLENFVKKQ